MTPLVASLLIWDKKDKGEISVNEAIKLVQKLETYSVEYDERPDVHFAHAKMIAETLGVPGEYCKQNCYYFDQSSLMEQLRDFINMVSVKNSQGKTIYIEDILGFNKYCPLELKEIDGKLQLVYTHHATGSEYRTYNGYWGNHRHLRVDCNFDLAKCPPLVIEVNDNSIETLKMLLDYLKNINDEQADVFYAYYSYMHRHYSQDFSTLVEVRDYLKTVIAQYEAEQQKETNAEQTTTTEAN